MDSIDPEGYGHRQETHRPFLPALMENKGALQWAFCCYETERAVDNSLAVAKVEL